MLFEHENIVVGSSLEALLYAFINNYPVFFAECRKPFEFEFLDSKTNLSAFLINNETNKFKSTQQDYLFGPKKLVLWEKLYFLLSIAGQIPLSDLCDTIRYDGELLTCSTDYEKLCKISFDKCYYFGDNRVYKLITERGIENARYRVYDKLGFNRGGKHEIDYLETDDNFVHKVWFYSSDRVCGDTGVKDACILSILNNEQLKESCYTQTMSSFKLIDLMKKNGLRGKFNGFTKSGTPRYYNFRTSHINRSIYLIDNPVWDETNSIKKVNTPVDELIKMASTIDLQNYNYLNGSEL